MHRKREAKTMTLEINCDADRTQPDRNRANSGQWTLNDHLS
jgi:hypothetical protein